MFIDPIINNSTPAQPLSFRHLLSSKQILESDINKIFSCAEIYRRNSKIVHKSCQDLIMASLFFEPSTRTRFSFESAMLKLGGKIISLEGKESSSLKKGETLSDTGRMMNNYADIIVMRHFLEGSVAEFSKFVDVPVINAGDGANEHPTQCLVDLYTIFVEMGRLTNLKIAILGDLKHARAFHSFLNVITKYSGNKLTLISPPSLRLESDFKNQLAKNGAVMIESTAISESIQDVDILYVSRIQKERFENVDEYENIKNSYFIDKKIIQNAHPNLKIMHALPRINEIAEEVDFMPQAIYFRQAQLAVYLRMALLSLMVNS